MTPEQIEVAICANSKPLVDVAKAMIALENAAEALGECLGANSSFSVTWSDFVDEEINAYARDFFEDQALPYELTVWSSTTVEEIVHEVYKGIKANLLKPENRLKAAISQLITVETS